MSKKLIPNKFFKENPLEDISSARATLFMMTDELNEIINKMICEDTEDELIKQDLEKLEEEKVKISNLKNGEEVFNFIRKGFSNFNMSILREKVLSIQEETIPYLLRRYRTSQLDKFIEAVVEIISFADMKYTDELYNIYKNIANPYAQSMACLVFAVQKRIDMLPFLMSEYYRFLELYPDDEFCEGPLVAIYHLCGKE